MSRRPLPAAFRSFLVGSAVAALACWWFGGLETGRPVHAAAPPSASIPVSDPLPLPKKTAHAVPHRPPPRVARSYGMAVQDVLDAPGSTSFADRCRDVLPLTVNVSGKTLRSFCALAARFDGLLNLRYAQPEMSDADHDALCADARSDLAAANAWRTASSECGEASGEVLAWTDEAWLAGCIGTQEWAGAYRSFLTESASWQASSAMCRTTASVWSSNDAVEPPPSLSDPDERWAAQVDNLGWTQTKLCTQPILGRLRAEQASGQAPLLFINDPDMAELARACIEGEHEWVPGFNL